MTDRSLLHQSTLERCFYCAQRHVDHPNGVCEGYRAESAVPPAAACPVLREVVQGMESVGRSCHCGRGLDDHRPAPHRPIPDVLEGAGAVAWLGMGLSARWAK